MNIEMEITLRCNARCPQCSRHCNLFDYNETEMTMEQVDKFIRQVQSGGNKIGLISIMGGEPTIHPCFGEIVDLLYRELYLNHFVRFIRIATNGIKPIAPEIKKLPIKIITSPPKNKKHRCQFIAPADCKQEVKRKCNIPADCGIALNCFGYFPCGAGGAIVRLFNMPKFIRHKLPISLNDFGDISDMCNLCQAFAKHPKMVASGSSDPSLSFKRAIENYHLQKPKYPLF